MRNIFIIALIVISMGYMFSILFDKYNSAVEIQDRNTSQQNK
jgi:hypothetical protein